MKHRPFLLLQWCAARMFAFFWLIVIPLIAWSNLSADLETGQPLDWSLVVMALGMMVWGVFLVEVMRRWFNFMLGTSECRWRTTR